MRKIETLAVLGLVAVAPHAALASSIIIDDFGDDVMPAIPEPTSALLMAAGLVTVAVVHRLRK